MRHSQKERHSFLIRKIEGSNPSVSEYTNFFFKNRVYSLRVEHTAHNGKNVGSNPTKPKIYFTTYFFHKKVFLQGNPCRKLTL